jgi:glycosyltransferase involved in cell wall biosynthesis
MKLSIIIPCFNERATVSEILSRVEAYPHNPKEIIIVDDGSTDGTREVLAERPMRDYEKVIFHEINRGKGSALRTGIGAATGDIIIIQDADLEYDPKDIPRLIKPHYCRQCGRSLWIAVCWRRSSPRAAILAPSWKWSGDTML